MNKGLLKYFGIAVLAMCLLALYPQISLWISQGSNWNGSYFVSNYDETAYSAYVNKLIEGGTRKSDPFIGHKNEPQSETLYSIQFIPAYSIAIPARIFGVSVSTAFIFLSLFIAIFSTIVLILLFYDQTGEILISTVGSLVVLCFGTAIAFQGELRYLIDGRLLVDFLPFLRRYQPGFAFPLFFIFCLFVWRSAGADRINKLIYCSVAGGLVFAALVFSYFYLWTAAAAWLFCFAVISLIVNKSNRKNVLVVSGIIGVFAAAALIPFFYLLSLRNQNLDSIQLLTLTRMPELFSLSMVFGIVTAILAVLFYKRRNPNLDVGRLVVILTFALTPVILFNQQMLTGRSLQPIHYEIFIANYLVLISAVLLLWNVVITKGASFRRALVYLGVVAVSWGFFEAYGSASRNAISAEIRDESLPAIEYANTLAVSPERSIIHATNFVTADFVSSASSSRSLWNAHTSSSGGVDIQENKRLFYLYLYYSGIGPKELSDALKHNSFEMFAAIFGSERALPSLGNGAKKITIEEVNDEIKKYADFSNTFSEKEAREYVLSSIIVPTEAEPSFTNIDKWYMRDNKKDFGLFTVYRLSLKAPK